MTGDAASAARHDYALSLVVGAPPAIVLAAAQALADAAEALPEGDARRGTFISCARRSIATRGALGSAATLAARATALAERADRLDRHERVGVTLGAAVRAVIERAQSGTRDALGVASLDLLAACDAADDTAPTRLAGDLAAEGLLLAFGLGDRAAFGLAARAVRFVSRATGDEVTSDAAD
ncbi:hypothetical protein J8M97_14370 [Gordonia polyisoprenivorans]|uniref:hypothetical protein n=1 Tax=Gordonia polyisoprenivorans TaxID=84595 RepID=UPI000B99E13C|nr:hypothetical protein [Gordonia polyisoprenivorans]OZC29933.1 hypothetical protein CJJ17_25100 [Gordonia polyisoprenivorans]QUD81034.1 hypothetical protein J8M97_14370 [Gordonia polyisoprenivorans]